LAGLRSPAFRSLHSVNAGAASGHSDEEEPSSCVEFTSSALQRRAGFSAMMESDPARISSGELLYYKEAAKKASFGVWSQHGNGEKTLLRSFPEQLDAVLFMEEIADRATTKRQECTYSVERITSN